MNRRWKTAAGFALALVAAVVIANRLPQAPSAPPTPSRVLPGTPMVPAPSGTDARPEVGFRNRELLVEHYQKHGREFGDVSVDEYLQLAQQLRDRPAGGEVLEIVRRDGVISRFDRASGAFLAFDPDGTLRTFFRPRDGERYFRRQAQRAGGP